VVAAANAESVHDLIFLVACRVTEAPRLFLPSYATLTAISPKQGPLAAPFDEWRRTATSRESERGHSAAPRELIERVWTEGRALAAVVSSPRRRPRRSGRHGSRTVREGQRSRPQGPAPDRRRCPRPGSVRRKLPPPALISTSISPGRHRRRAVSRAGQASDAAHSPGTPQAPTTTSIGIAGLMTGAPGQGSRHAHPPEITSMTAPDP
jgi:hypothetical protein